MSHDIDEWSTAFLDPSWTHEVIRLTEVCNAYSSCTSHIIDLCVFLFLFEKL